MFKYLETFWKFGKQLKLWKNKFRNKLKIWDAFGNLENIWKRLEILKNIGSLKKFGEKNWKLGKSLKFGNFGKKWKFAKNWKLGKNLEVWS